MNGACKYCGQIFMVPEDSKDPDKEATRACNCDGAVFMRKVEDNMMRGKANVIQICDDEDVRAFLNHAIDLAGTGKLRTATHKDSNGVKYTVKMNEDTTFKIEKVTTTKESIE